ncbi:putative Cytidylate kinase [Paratrimastix pyriformis]|uniref:(d)CMP kinase n=1 Tax=Paratrimastix pyriformis TaxID=342808 RepID=A0ABQ8USD4_9EUKA|nr:putative Cytidylate kinase [Paratrimastix pyriformis]
MTSKTLVVTLDGPAGSGKSTLAKKLADALNFQFLDTGATYRAVTFECMHRGVNLDDTEAVKGVASSITITFSDGGQRVLIDGVDRSREIRTREVTNSISKVANKPEIREILVTLQRKIASTGQFVTEGRDQGTVCFPDALWKFYIVASPQLRAERRLAQMIQQGLPVPAEGLPAILQDVIRRDEADMSRAVGPLRKAEDAIEVSTDGQTEAESLNHLVELVHQRAPVGLFPAH